jgi:serine/threonine-protein kinase
MNAPDAPVPSPDRVSEIFARALMEPVRLRDEFVSQACGDEEALRGAVLSLLAAFPKGELVFEEQEREIGRVAASMAEGDQDRDGETISHYRIDRFLGAGGMGEVYKAWDTALGRPAAIKLLHPGMDSQVRSRLVREARTSARLEHPAIAAFYESGTVDGREFLAMEFVEGETLRSRLQRGALPAADAVSMVAAMLEALVHSHAAGVVHRDIKPENIMLAKSRAVKLLDFGIAKDVTDPDEVHEEAETRTVVTGTKLTSQGMMVGTLGYMSPEQMRGEPVNERTDVFAMGAVLYESLTGEAAFPGESARERMASTVSRDIPYVNVNGVHPDINAIIRRATARNVEERYGTAREFLADLRRYATGEAVAMLPDTLAVMDLENLTGREEDEWIGTGMAESLGVDLRRAEGLSLVPRAKVVGTAARLAAMSAGKVDPVALGFGIGCRWVLTGTYQRMGGALRLTMRLVEVSTGADVWTEKLDGRVEGIFEMQDRLAAATAKSLKLVVPDTKRTRGPRLSAYEYYAKAKALWKQMGEASTDQAQECLEKAIDIDPEYAPALAYLASIHAPLRYVQSGDPGHLEAALRLTRRSLEVDPACPEANVWEGYAKWRLGKTEAALESLGRAEELGVEFPPPAYFIACCLNELGRWEEGIAAAQRAVAVEPRLAPAWLVLGTAQMETPDLPTARWTLERAWELEGAGSVVHWAGAGTVLVECLRRQRELDLARDKALECLKILEGEDLMSRSALRSLTLTALGRTALDRGEPETARIAFQQALSIGGKPSMGGGNGHLMVQARAGLTCAGGGPGPFEKAVKHFRNRKHVDFAYGGLASDVITSLDLAKAARVLDRQDEVDRWMKSARHAGYRDGADPTAPG